LTRHFSIWINTAIEAVLKISSTNNKLFSSKEGMVWLLTLRFQKYFYGIKVMSSDEKKTTHKID
jgi:hypothetical protein